MNKAPEKIYITNRPTKEKVTCGFWDDVKDSNTFEYIRADLVPQWLPIETIKETGNEVLLIHATGLNQVVAVYGTGASGKRIWKVKGTGIYPLEAFTHFMSLPKAPT